MQVDTILQSKGPAVYTVTTGAPIADAVRVLNEKRVPELREHARKVLGIRSRP